MSSGVKVAVYRTRCPTGLLPKLGLSEQLVGRRSRGSLEAQEVRERSVVQALLVGERRIGPARGNQSGAWECHPAISVNDSVSNLGQQHHVTEPPVVHWSAGTAQLRDKILD